jgi:hypothetical protein
MIRTVLIAGLVLTGTLAFGESFPVAGNGGAGHGGRTGGQQRSSNRQQRPGMQRQTSQNQSQRQKLMMQKRTQLQQARLQNRNSRATKWKQTRPFAASTSSPIQTNSIETSSSQSPATSSSLVSSEKSRGQKDLLPPFLRDLNATQLQQVRTFFASQTADQRQALRRDLQNMTPEQRKAEILRRVKPTSETMSPAMAAVMDSEKPVPQGTPIVINAKSQKSKFQAYGMGTSGRMPKEGKLAPSFSLETADGATVSLLSYRGKPLVIEFGSITDPIYRRGIGAMDRVYFQYKDKAAFLLIYTLEAHPKGSASPYSNAEWVPERNEQDSVLYPQTANLQERRQRARELMTTQREKMPIAMDSMSNDTWKAYGARPNSAFVISGDGRIIAAQESARPDAISDILKKL